jgi:hypothetical protein
MRSACPWPWKLHNSPLARGGAVFGGGKGGSGGTTYQTQQTTIPPEVQARYNAVNQRAEQVAQQPFKPYEGQFVAPLTATQQAGTAQIANAGQGYQPYQQAATTALTGSAEAALPYYGQAGQNIGAAQAAGAPYTGAATMAGLAGAQSINPGQLDIGRYMDPYLQSVVAPTMQGLYQQQQQQQSQLMGSQAMRGAFGGDRGSIAAANLARQQGLAAQQAQGGLLSQGYGQALQAAQQQQGVGLGAEQANRAAMQQLSPQLLQIGQQAFQQPMAAAQAQQGLGQGLLGYGQGVSQSLAGLGQMGTQTGLASGQALLGAGTLEQQTQQQLNAALYNQYQQQQGYPFQVAQFLANIAMGTGPLYGSTTSGVTGQPTPFFSDERVKEDITEIGRTHDGQKIIKFKYKGSNQPQIGLSAQDVEKHHPEAVSETPEGIKAVDYDMATAHAERPHAYAGGLMPSSEGGAVHPSMAGLGFASGGTPVPGANPEVDEMLRGLAPRRAFADGGEAELMRKLYPWGAAGGLGGGTPGAGGAWSPGLTVKPQAPLGSGAQLKAPAPRPTGLSQTVDAVKGGLGAVDDAKKLYKTGKEGYEWAKDAVGKVRDKLELPDLTKQAEDYAADPNVNPTVARGGRIGYEGGGDVAEDETPAIPGGGDDTVLGKLTAQQVTPAKLPEHKLDMDSSASGQKKDGTGKAIGSLAGAGIGAMFGPAGMGVGSTLGGLLGGMFARGGATGIEHAKGLISRVESGGNYSAMGPLVRGDRAHGKYQVMGANIPSWTEEALGRRMTPAEFLKSPEAQERVFEHQFGKYLAQHGNLADAASMWHSGVPLSEARRQGRRDVNMSTEDYVAKILGGAPPAEAHMRTETPPQRSAGLAPSITAAEDTHEGLAPVDTGDDFEMFNNFEMPDRFKHFASGGLVPRRGYQTDGAVAEPSETIWDRLNRTVPVNLPVTPGGSPAPQTAQAPSADPLDDIAADALRRDPAEVSAARAPAPQTAQAPPLATGVAPPAAAPPSSTSPPGAATAPGVAPPKPADISLANDPRLADRNFFDRAGDWMGRNQNWLLPAVSGIGKMLASPSPYLGVAIGQGLAEGAQTGLGASFKQQGLDVNQQQADVSSARELYRLRTETGTKLGELIANRAPSAQLEPLQKQYDILGQYISRLLGRYVKSPGEAQDLLGGAPAAGAPAAGAPAAGAPAAGAPTAGAPAAGAPVVGAPASDVPDWARPAGITPEQQQEIARIIDPARDPAKMRAEALAMASVDSEGSARRRREADAIQAEINASGRVPVIGGGFTTLPGFNSMQAQTQRTADNTQWKNTYENRQQNFENSLSTAAELGKALQEAQTGPLRGAINNVAALVQGFTGQTITATDPDAFQIARKNAYKLVMDNLKSAGAMTDTRYEGLSSANADMNLLPEANKAILSELTATAQWAQERDNWLNEQMSKYPAMDRAAAAQAWARLPGNDLNGRIERVKKDIAVLGDIDTALVGGAPDPSKLKTGQMYMLPVGNGHRRARFIGVDPNTGGAMWRGN